MKGLNYNTVFGFLLNIAIIRVYPLFFLLNSIYYNLNGVKMVNCLNSSLFHRVYENKTILLFYFTFMNANIMHLLFFEGNLNQIIQKWFSLKPILNWICVYIIEIRFSLPCIITHYYKWAVLKSLKSLNSATGNFVDSGKKTFNKHSRFSKINIL